ncbi:MAG: prenyltransferase [Candidatus Nitrosocosmicus sp.]
MNRKLHIWLRAIRFRFLAASAIAVTNGLVLGYLYNPVHFNIFYAVFIYIGIFCLHSSVDLFNDYWDYKRKIDLFTKKTKFSGGTGVLPEGLLKPNEVYRAAILFLIFGLSVGISFVFIKGYIIALILGFATLSIILYSTKLVNVGLGELFVGIKGMLIVVGSFYIQTNVIVIESLFVGLIAGLLSSLVLFMNSIPDIKADREHGRRTLAIIFENYSWDKKLILLLFLFISIYCLTFYLYYFLLGNPFLFVLDLLFIPLSFSIIENFYFFTVYKKEVDTFYEKIMAKTVLFSRLYGISITIGLLIWLVFHFKK